MRKRTIGPLVLGHRGYRARFPENTLLAFREALAAGAHGIECDIQKTADGRYVVIHDANTGRVAATHRGIASSSLSDLREIDVGSSQRIPLLEEMLAMLPAHAFLDLEVKEETLTPSDGEEIARILDSFRDRRNLMVSSFGASLLVPFRKKGFVVGYLVGDETVMRGARAFVRTLFTLRPQYLNLPVQVFERIGASRARFLFRLLRVLGFSFLFWTVNSTEFLPALRPFARIIVTDEVELLVAACAAEKRN
jgi:glycerophosphoryl diester phosphodiesterase